MIHQQHQQLRRIPLKTLRIRTFGTRHTTTVNLSNIPRLFTHRNISTKRLHQLLWNLRSNHDFSNTLSILRRHPTINSRLRRQTTHLQSNRRQRHRQRPTIHHTRRSNTQSFNTTILRLIRIQVAPATTQRIILTSLPRNLHRTLNDTTQVTTRPRILHLRQNTTLRRTRHSLTNTQPSIGRPIPQRIIRIPLTTHR